MKNTSTGLLLLALASTGYAQSKVEIFGHIDMNISYAKNGSGSVVGVDQGGYALPSRLGFRGVEDLGSGTSVGFWLESAIFPDTGGTNTSFFNRRSTISLINKSWGELKLGRDYTPAFYNISSFSPFGTVGMGGSSNLIEGWPVGVDKVTTMQRASNMLTYILPTGLGGFYGQLHYAFDEKTKDNGYTGARLGWAQGPVDVAAAYGRVSLATDHYAIWTAGGSYQWDRVKLFANYVQQKTGDAKYANAWVGAAVPLAQGTLKLSYSHGRNTVDGARGTARQYAIGYHYPLSKRTTLYTAAAFIDNSANTAYSVSDLSNGLAGSNSRGVQLGISHSF